MRLSHPWNDGKDINIGKPLSLLSKQILVLAFIDLNFLQFFRDFPGGSDSKASAYNVGDLGSIPGSGRSPGEGNGNPLQYSCLENPIDREAWYATGHGVTKSRTRPRDFTFKEFHQAVQWGKKSDTEIHLSIY